MKKQKIEDIFSSIENFSSVPPPELWSKIEEELDKPKKKKKVILWWSAAACLLLGLLLPSVLHLNSDSGIETINNVSIEKSVVLDENKKDLNNTEKASIEKNNIEKKSDIVENSSLEDIKNQSNNSQNRNTYRTTITHTDSNNKINSGISNENSKIGTKNMNEAVAEKTYTAGKQNSFNSFSNNQIPAEKRNENQALAEKTFAAGKQNSFNSFSNNQIPAEKRNENQAVAEKTFAAGKQNSFNSFSNNQIPAEKRNENQGLAEKTFDAGKQNSFNSFSNNQIPAEKRNENQGLAEKTFSAGKQNSVNSFSDNQLPNSIFEDKLTSKNTVAVTMSTSNLVSDNKPNIKKEGSDQTVSNKTIVAENVQKNNSITAHSLNKQDSLQLVELQNLEKGIVEIKTEKDKEIKPDANSEKWSLEVFAGIANSENYNNQKTLGNVNESKQTNSYGVKTNYKLNKKWAVSSGLKINELGQSIANVSYYNNHNLSSSPVMSDYFSPNSFASGATPKITNNSSYVFVSKNTSNALKSDNLESGNMEQSLKYIEMPLEVSYALFSKNKTNISLNTGGFVGKLISNNVTLNGNSIGDNSNASDFVYGSLLSSTFQYRLYKKTHVFVEPGMNYYINPLTNQTFNQFQWSFNFGLNVSF
ncbi:hypothetical protein [Flavobacterium hydrophilum]|uniref:Outer membrane protein beta-barrel domain-containing protein n=1 Tax=Flavobacterium hydrophilum TaxID=2211445 RepID=A0A2V4BZ05_9FLAO|nr:hypothetical protein [Flavobacterium hydrophilum]PXY44261.1 hypothetical protein DMB68_17720 [Flavobacterium hydrophilum]